MNKAPKQRAIREEPPREKIIRFADLPKTRVGVHLPETLAKKAKHAAVDTRDSLNKFITAAIAEKLGEDPGDYGIANPA